ncbi:MAG: tocopherol cyclase family protein [Christensenellaceae bacterium]|jgi:hypothetical protein|nr:tocopherol cyclase family protein [Christensenellaceae bacterium]
MGYFEGTYIKCSNRTESIAFIFGSCDNKSFVQIITKDNSSILEFDEPTPLRYDAMGPFKFLPFMECKHKVTSMGHKVSGKVAINGHTYDFDNGIGYIEGDRGHSFPKKDFWTQYNTFADGELFSISASCAKIPYLGMKFTGTICFIIYKGKEIRLATYKGARVREFTESKLVVIQRHGRKKLVLEITVLENKNMQSLAAPNKAKMSRTIKETVQCKMNYKLVRGKNILFDVTVDNAAFEWDNTL